MYVPDHLKTQEMCDEAVCMELYALEFVPDCFKTQEMFTEAVKAGPWQLNNILDWFVVLQEIWC